MGHDGGFARNGELEPSDGVGKWGGGSEGFDGGSFECVRSGLLEEIVDVSVQGGARGEVSGQGLSVDFA